MARWNGHRHLQSHRIVFVICIQFRHFPLNFNFRLWSINAGAAQRCDSIECGSILIDFRHWKNVRKKTVQSICTSDAHCGQSYAYSLLLYHFVLVSYRLVFRPLDSNPNNRKTQTVPPYSFPLALVCDVLNRILWTMWWPRRQFAFYSVERFSTIPSHVSNSCRLSIYRHSLVMLQMSKCNKHKWNCNWLDVIVNVLNVQQKLNGNLNCELFQCENWHAMVCFCWKTCVSRTHV